MSTSYQDEEEAREQDLSSARRTLNLTGIQSIVVGAIVFSYALYTFVVTGVIAMQPATSGYVGSNENLPADSVVSLYVVSCTLLAIAGIVLLIQGYFSHRASRDSSALRAAYISSIAGLALAAIELVFFLTIDTRLSRAIVFVIGFAWSGAIFRAAKTCRDSA